MATVVNSRPGGANIPAFDSVADTRKLVVLREEFIGHISGTLDDTNTGIGELGFIVTDVAGAADSDVDIVTTAATVIGHPGVISLNTGPTTPATSDEAGLTLPGAVVLPSVASGQMIYLASTVRFPSVTSVEFNFGLFDLSLGAGRDTDSVSIELDISADTEFNLVSEAGSSVVGAAVASETTAAVDTWYSLELAANATSVYGWVNGEYIGKVIGTHTALPLYPGFKVATETNGEKSVLIDNFMLRHPVDR